MIRVTVTAYKKEISVEVDGHSAYNARGSDIVCAGVTALVMGIAPFGADTEAGDGYFYSVFSETDALAVDTFVNGIREIERLYPDYVELVC